MTLLIPNVLQQMYATSDKWIHLLNIVDTLCVLRFSMVLRQQHWSLVKLITYYAFNVTRIMYHVPW